MTPEDIAAAAAAAVGAGAVSLHIHPKDVDGHDTLAADRVAAILSAVRAAAPGVPVGVTTGAWTAAGAHEIIAAIDSWVELPDFASVNWHEDGAEEIADALLARGVDVEAGLWHVAAAQAWQDSVVRDRCVRVLIELPADADVGALTAIMLDSIDTRRPLLLHGEGASAWPAIEEAQRRGLATRIGLEDTLTMPDGAVAAGNAELVREVIGVRPARPYRRFTDDGRRMREVLTYSRRGSRFTHRQLGGWNRRAAAWVIPDDAVDVPGDVLTGAFDREAPLIIEIGSGVGEATAAVAAAYPDHNVLAFEVWRPGVADTLVELEEAGVENVRLLGVDAVWALEHLIAPGSVAQLLTFFPDPWPKKRHHKRRLVGPRFATIAAQTLEIGGTWRLATDWGEYADQMREVLDAEPLLSGGVAPRWDLRPLTRFERRGIAEGREICDLAYQRIDESESGAPTSK